MSVWQSPVATIRTRISPSRGPSRSTSSSEKSPPGWLTTATVGFIGFSLQSLGIAEICVGPRADYAARPMRLAALGEQMVGALERDEAARVAGQAEDLARVLDADGVVGGRVQDQQRQVEALDLVS